MVGTTFIPSGQTSMVKKGKVSLQVQTEYSARPYPRIKTTIFDSGRVVHKIEKKLERPIDSVDEQNKIEGVMKVQHQEVVSVIRDKSFQPGLDVSENPMFPGSGPSLKDKLASLPGVQRIFCLDEGGRFIGSNTSSQFRKAFSAVYKGLPVIMDVFSSLPGSLGREKGVCEIERDRLYFASAGDKFYFVTVQRVNQDIDYERSIKEIICPTTEF